MAAAIEVTHLKKSFVLPMSRKKVAAIDDLSFTVQEGGIVGFLGANGAGKTTTLKSILRLIFPDSGTVRIFGKDHTDLTSRSQIGFLTERPYFYDYLSGREFLRFCAQLFNSPEAIKRVDPLLEEVGLGHAADRPLRRYSKGMLQRVGIAQALVNNPKLLILDEPMSGLDPDGRAEISKIIAKANKRGATVLFSTHLLPDVENLCERVVMINSGKLVVESTVTDLLNRQASGFLLEYIPSKGEASAPVKKEFSDDTGLQKSIAECVRAGDRIIRVTPSRPSLEEVFIKLKKGGA